MKKLLLTGFLLGMALFLLHCAAGNQAQQSYNAKDYNQTLTLCKQAIAVDSMDSESLLLMAKAYLELDSLLQADTALERALHIKLDDPESEKEASKIYFQLAERSQKNSNVIVYLKKAEELSPESPEVLEQLGALYEKAGELEEAKIRYENLVEIARDPTQFVPLVNTLESKIGFASDAYAKGKQSYDENDYDTAIKQISAAAEAYPGMSEAVYYLNLSRTKIIKRNPNEAARIQARKYLRTASEANPTKAESHFLMAQFYEMENDKNLLDEAIHHYTLSFKLEPSGPFAKKSKAKVKSLTKKKEKLDKFWGKGRNPN
ncbi:hypothetical protein HQ585_08460 [candidate division KSB1 bacterium]|nr:hypothetical protein [candidate division KSB1 bacterium]